MPQLIQTCSTPRSRNRFGESAANPIRSAVVYFALASLFLVESNSASVQEALDGAMKCKKGRPPKEPVIAMTPNRFAQLVAISKNDTGARVCFPPKEPFDPNNIASASFCVVGECASLGHCRCSDLYHGRNCALFSLRCWLLYCRRTDCDSRRQSVECSCDPALYDTRVLSEVYLYDDGKSREFVPPPPGWKDTAGFGFTGVTKLPAKVPKLKLPGSVKLKKLKDFANGRTLTRSRQNFFAAIGPRRRRQSYAVISRKNPQNFNQQPGMRQQHPSALNQGQGRQWTGQAEEPCIPLDKQDYENPRVEPYRPERPGGGMNARPRPGGRKTAPRPPEGGRTRPRPPEGGWSRPRPPEGGWSRPRPPEDGRTRQRPGTGSMRTNAGPDYSQEYRLFAKMLGKRELGKRNLPFCEPAKKATQKQAKDNNEDVKEAMDEMEDDYEESSAVPITPMSFHCLTILIVCWNPLVLNRCHQSL